MLISIRTVALAATLFATMQTQDPYLALLTAANTHAKTYTYTATSPNAATPPVVASNQSMKPTAAPTGGEPAVLREAEYRQIRCAAFRWQNAGRFGGKNGVFTHFFGESFPS